MKKGCRSRQSNTFNRIISRVVVFLSVLTVSVLMTTISVDYAYAAEPNVNAESAVVISGSTGEVIYEKHAERKLPISITGKLVEAMVVIDNMDSEKELDKKINLNRDASERGDIFEENESVSVRDLLYAMLFNNSNEAAAALAIYSCGSIQSCVDQMNAKVQQMRLMSTRFINVTGDYDLRQYSSAMDIAAITKAAYSYDRIKQISSTPSYELSKTDKHEKRSITNGNPLISGENAYKGAGAGMMGSLKEPDELDTFTGTAIVDDMCIIVVLLNESSGSVPTDAATLFDYGFDNATKNIIVKKGKQVGKVKVRHGEKTHVPMYTAGKGYVYIPPEGSGDLVTTSVDPYDNVKAPLKKGDKVGNYNIYVAGELKGSVDLVVAEDIETGLFPSYIYISDGATLVIAVILLIIIFLYIRALSISKKKKRERDRKRREEIRRMALERKAIEDDRARRNWTYSEGIPERPKKR